LSGAFLIRSQLDEDNERLVGRSLEIFIFPTMQSQTVITGVIFLMHCYSSYTHCCADRDLRTVSVIDGASNTLIEEIVVGTELVALLFNPI
jgi:hypothetical protein